MIDITIFTPTFNRGYIIEQLYRSLQKQTLKNFEWIVINDGSTDSTNDLFEKWVKNDNGFNIIYLETENGGKHRAINKALSIAHGVLFFIVDSDDYLTENAIERVMHWSNSINKDDRFAGVAGLRGTSTSIVGKTFNGEFCDATYIEREKYKIIGDKAEVFLTDVLMKYRFPEFDNERFITESTVWNQIALDGYLIRWFNEVIYMNRYMDDGLTAQRSKIFAHNPKGTLFSCKQNLAIEKISLRRKIASIYYCCVAEKMRGNSIFSLDKELNISKIKILFAYVIGIVYEQVIFNLKKYNA